MSDERRSLLAEKTPFPDDLDERLRAQLTFLVEVDQLKTILRQSPWPPRTGARTTRSIRGTWR